MIFPNTSLKMKNNQIPLLKSFLPTTTASFYNAEAMNNSSRIFYLNVENHRKWYYNEKYWSATLMIVIMISIPEKMMPVFNQKSFTSASGQFQKFV